VRPHATARERWAAALSGTAAACLIAGGAWYFVAAVWWLVRHDWPRWTWARLAEALTDHGNVTAAGAVGQFLLELSPGATVLSLAAILAGLARVIDPSRRRR